MAEPALVGVAAVTIFGAAANRARVVPTGWLELD
jgi:hypothetical protein